MRPGAYTRRIIAVCGLSHCAEAEILQVSDMRLELSANLETERLEAKKRIKTLKEEKEELELRLRNGKERLRLMLRWKATFSMYPTVSLFVRRRI